MREIRPVFAAPAAKAVKLPERMKEMFAGRKIDVTASSWNACLDEVAKLNGIEP